MKCFRDLTLFLPAFCCWINSFSQSNTYILNGAASQNNCNCYTLTPAANTQSGSVWNANKISLNNPFDFVFNVYLGCQDANGADGIVFMLQPISTSVGTTGEGMGFEGVAPSIGISLDTWQNQNRNDPVYDHISIQANGNVTHGTDLAGPIQASSTQDNIEDCQWHTFRISWDPVSKTLRTYFDGVFRLETVGDIVANIFNNDPMVYWGFSAGTGGANNLQQFCTALNPAFTTSISGNSTCLGNSIDFTNTSQSFAPIASYFWSFGDGNTSTAPNPPSHTYASAGIYEVKLAIKGLDGCFSDTLRKTIHVGDYPIAAFDVFDTCNGFAPRIVDKSTVAVGSITEWEWLLNGNPVSVSQLPQLNNLEPQGYQLQLRVKSNHGCSSTPVSRGFIIKKRPTIEASGPAGACINQPVGFTARQMDNATWVDSWHWDFGNNNTSSNQNPDFTFTSQGQFTVNVYAVEANGCKSETQSVDVLVTSVFANAGNDTVVIRDMPFLLLATASTNGSTGIPTYTWSPSLYLSDPTVLNPTAILQNDQTYYLTVQTPEGCEARDTINLSVFKGSAIYVPTGFTPNNDGRNEMLLPYYAGIKSLDFFSVYNRWGELVFTTNNMSKGWDGKLRSMDQPTGSYVWMLRATDYAGKIYQLKGTSTIIR